jgi:tetratricopeptide (TPR) repeat protein
MLARVELAEGNLTEARHYTELACSVASEENPRWLAECNDMLGAIHTLACDWEAAQAALERAVEQRQRMIYPAGHADSLMELGLVHEMRGDWSRALELYATAVDGVLGPDRGVRLLTARRHYGRLLLRLGQLDAAAEQIDAALWLTEKMPETIESSPALLTAAEFALSKGNLLDALAYANRARSAPKTAEISVHVDVLSAMLHAELGMVAQASELAEQALKTAQRIGGPHLLGLAQLATGQVAAVEGHQPVAAAAFLAADQYFVTARTPYSRAIVAFACGQALNGGRDRRAAIEESMRIFAELGAQPSVIRLPEAPSSELRHAVLVP